MKKIFKNVKYEKYYKDILPYIKKDKNQQYLAIILTLGASIFFALFAINPTLATIVKLRREVKDSKIVEQQLSQKVKDMSALSQAYQNIQEDIPFLLEAIPLQPEAPTLVAQIQSVAQDAETPLSNLIVSPVNLIASPATESSRMLFEFTTQATYANVNKLLTNLTEIQRIVSIDSFSITNTGIDSANVELNLKGSALFKK